VVPHSVVDSGGGRSSCPLTIETIPTGGFAGQYLDVDTEGGLASNPAYCGQTPGPTQVDVADRTFGARAADSRFFDIDCTATGKHWQIEQYVVATDPGFILFSETADASVQAAMAIIVAHSTLPPQSSPLRYEDCGYVRSIAKATGGQTVTLDLPVHHPRRRPGGDHDRADGRTTARYLDRRSQGHCDRRRSALRRTSGVRWPGPGHRTPEITSGQGGSGQLDGVADADGQCRLVDVEGPLM
jgi:hypothetical protein